MPDDTQNDPARMRHDYMGESARSLQVLLIDLDDTVYPRESGLMKEVGRLVLRYMVERMHIPQDQAPMLRKRYYQQYGTTLRGLQIHHQVDAEDYLRFVHDIPLEKFLQPDPALDRALASIPQEKVIFTNATTEHAEGVLRQVGVRQHFGQIVDIRALQFVNKPNPQAYRRALSLVRVPAGACMVVEDTLHNLIPARALGMATVLVSSDGHDEARADLVIPTLADLPWAVEQYAQRVGADGETSE